jgi:Raf kinase inhibitor-like YbhB/YbcL family protein
MHTDARYASSSRLALGFCLALLVVACQGGNANEGEVSDEATAGDSPAELPLISVTSTAFAGGEVIPTAHTCDADDLSPPLAFGDLPEATSSIALICDDPDAPMGTWVHWVLYNLPAGTDSLPQGMPDDAELESGARQGITDFRRPGYGGPCPPKGKPHRYFFKVYALDTKLELTGTVGKERLVQAMEGHVLAYGELMGTYQRR